LVLSAAGEQQRASRQADLAVHNAHGELAQRPTVGQAEQRGQRDGERADRGLAVDPVGPGREQRDDQRPLHRGQNPGWPDENQPAGHRHLERDAHRGDDGDWPA
jgi:hypothetical protein